MNKQIGQKLIEMRGARTREEVALAVGVSYNAIQMYETGMRVPRDNIKAKLAKYYGTTVDALFFSLESNV